MKFTRATRLSQLKREFKDRLDVRVERVARASLQRHDRRIRLTGPAGTTDIDLPYGLGFIGPDGKVVEDTRVYVVQSAAAADLSTG